MGNFADDDACKDRIQFTGDTLASQTRGKFSAIFNESMIDNRNSLKK